MIGARRLAVGGLILVAAGLPSACPAGEAGMVATNDTFPTVPEVLGGRTFKNYTEQDIYFLRAIHDRYPSHWTDLLEANLTLNDFVLAPEKLLRFVNELGEAMRGQDDLVACTKLAMITGDPAFYANASVSRPEILKAAAQALIKLGPKGRKALASTFTEVHYRSDPASLEVLGDALGEERPSDPEFVVALASTAFTFSTTNGAFYPRCVAGAVKDLLCLTNGLAVVRSHLKIGEVLNNPGLFQSVVDGIAEAQASELAADLGPIQAEVRAKLAKLAESPDGYRDDLQELEVRLGRTLASLGSKVQPVPNPKSETRKPKSE